MKITFLCLNVFSYITFNGQGVYFVQNIYFLHNIDIVFNTILRFQDTDRRPGHRPPSRNSSFPQKTRHTPEQT